ncbi:hypothetical protein Q5H92_14565 [Hymenobacter sp. M29]|uniref:Uncharacterized protein n=1 Tax=Hymenobacter mellowenesis TaxID=3063995 RepID=A0ABT9ACM0_9BACT|nr:hypothetical protein [Hymenobacter sp. M29]MDO7847590.1 hypothetical protein [Hymenobacter sp. M29]
MPKTFTEDQFRAVIQHTWNVWNGSYLAPGELDRFIDQQVKDFHTPPQTKEYWLEQAHHRFEAANYHSEFHMVKEAVEYMSEEKAIEYLKQVQTP